VEIGQVVLCRQLFMEAERYLSQGSAIHLGLAVSISQDAVELFLRAIIKDQDVPAQKVPDDFIKCMDYIDMAGGGDEPQRVPSRAKLIELNKARVNFKHYGLVPDKSDAARLLGYVEEFFEIAAPRFFGISFSSLSLADMLSEGDVKDKIKAAEESLKDQSLREGMYLCAEAVELAALQILHAVGQRGHIQLGMPRSLTQALGPEVARDLAGYISREMQTASRATLTIVLALNVHDYLRFEAIAPMVHGRYNGNFIRGRWTSIHEESATDLKFALDFATRFAASVDARMPSATSPDILPQLEDV
jgi:hypothetical protein